MKSTIEWHFIADDPKKLPEPGERVLICIGESFVGEGYLKFDKGELKWHRYCDFEPIENYMSQDVTAWARMPKPTKKKENEKGKEKQA